VSLRARDGLWSVRIAGDESEHLASTVAEALARATGRSLDDAWVAALEARVEASFARPHVTRGRAAGPSRLRRLVRALARRSPPPEGTR